MLLGAGYGLTMSTQSHFWEVADYSTTAITWIGLTNGIGITVGYLAAALYADRLPKQRLVRTAAILLAASSGVAALLELGDLIRGDWFYLIAALFGVPHGLAAAVILGWVGDLLPRRLIAKGVVVLSLASIPLGVLLTIPGVFLGEERYATFALFAVAFVLYLAAMAIARRVAVGSKSGRVDEAAKEGLKDGARYLWNDARLRALWCYLLVAGIFSTLLYAALGEHLLDEIDLDNSGYSWSLMAQGLAALVATICLVFVIGGARRWTIFLIAVAVSGVLIVLISFTSDLALLILLLIPQGAAMTVITLGGQALALSTTRSGYFGRVAASLLFAGSLLNFAAGFVNQFLYDWYEGRWPLLAIGLLLILAAVWLYRQWRGFRHLPEDPDPPQEKSGPRFPMAVFLTDRLAPQKPAAPD